MDCFTLIQLHLQIQLHLDISLFTASENTETVPLEIFILAWFSFCPVLCALVCCYQSHKFCHSSACKTDHSSSTADTAVLQVALNHRCSTHSEHCTATYLELLCHAVTLTLISCMTARSPFAPFWKLCCITSAVYFRLPFL
jgi:hypothetical protein